MAKAKPQKQHLTPAEFKAELARKGWTQQELADRWGFSINWISKIVRNEKRGKHFDDALVGLPLKIHD